MTARHLLHQSAGFIPDGTIAEHFVRHIGLAPKLRLFLATGVLGGFTTFSTYALEIVLLRERGATLAAVGYAFGSVAPGVSAVVLGLMLTR